MLIARTMNSFPARFGRYRISGLNHYCTTNSEKKKPCNTWPAWIEPQGTDTGIRVWNRQLKQKVPFITREENKINWYMCGPTVYDSPHIGHGLCYLRFDIIRRILGKYFGIDVTYIMGITDVDDKIINKANYFKVETGELTRHFEDEFWRDLDLLGIERPTTSMRVTENIANITDFIEGILQQNLAYRVADGSIFFNNVKYREMRGLTTPDDLDESVAVVDDSLEWRTDNPSPGKRHPIDFALWKSSKEGEPSWPSPFGPGRPGWHIECSAMASTALGKHIDVHTGGQDLVFPHHYCEEAQSCARFGQHIWTNYWWHSGHLSIDNEKMSKSIGNVVSVAKLLEWSSATVFRHFALIGHYRNPVRYHADTLIHASKQVDKIQSFLRQCEHFLVTYKPNDDNGKNQDKEHPLIQELNHTKRIVDQGLRDDFNTPRAVSKTMHLIYIANVYLNQMDESKHSKEIKSKNIAQIEMNYLDELSVNDDLDGVTSTRIEGLENSKIDHSDLPSFGPKEIESVRDFVIEINAALGNDYTQSKSVSVEVFHGIIKLMKEFTEVVRKFALVKEAQPEVVGFLDGAALKGKLLERASLLEAATLFEGELASYRTDGEVSVEDLDGLMKSMLAVREFVRKFALYKDMHPQLFKLMDKKSKKAKFAERAPVLEAADLFRQRIQQFGIDVQDQREGTTWQFKDTQPADDADKLARAK